MIAGISADVVADTASFDDGIEVAPAPTLFGSGALPMREVFTDAETSEDTIEYIDVLALEDAELLETRPESQVVRDLWEVSRWDLPVQARLELLARSERAGHDVGYERYAAVLCAA